MSKRERLLAWYRQARAAFGTRWEWLSERVRRRLGPRGPELVGWLAVALVLVGFQGGAVSDSIDYYLASERINGDAQQQIFPFFRYLDSSLFENDYIADYYLACFPLGYWGLYASAASLGIDPTFLSRILPHPAWLVAVVGVGAVAYKLGGKLSALCAMALALGARVYLDRSGGGLPRAFGFPILSMTLVSLAYARVWWGAACVVLGALFYPVTAVISGLSLAGMLLFPRVADLPPTPWTRRRRLAVLAGTAALSFVFLLPATLASSRFGEVVRPEDVREFPEAGKGGRYVANSRAPFPGFFASIPEEIDDALLGGTPAWAPEARAWLLRGGSGRRHEKYSSLLDVLLMLALIGGAGLVARKPAARRVLLLGVASGVGYTLARIVAPYAYLPERYVAYSVPLLASVTVSSALAGLFGESFEGGWRSRVKTAAIGAYVFLVLCLLGGRPAPDTGLDSSSRRVSAVLSAIAELPPDAVVAGWPQGVMDRVPYEARRSAFLTYECHQAFHKGYTLEMRKRMYALIAAYYATSPEPIVALRDELGVTHLLVERDYFEGKQPRYFRPFPEAIAERRAAAKAERYEVLEQVRRASIFSYRNYELLDLSQIRAR